MADLPDSIRGQVATRAAGRCEYCRSPEAYSSTSFSIDHMCWDEHLVDEPPSNGWRSTDPGSWHCAGL